MKRSSVFLLLLLPMGCDRKEPVELVQYEPDSAVEQASEKDSWFDFSGMNAPTEFDVVRPGPTYPVPDQIMKGSFVFKFEPVPPYNDNTPEYVVHLSTAPSFPRSDGSSVMFDAFVPAEVDEGGIVSSPTYDTADHFPGTTDVYWRIGVWTGEPSKFTVAGSNERRYIYSVVRRYKLK